MKYLDKYPNCKGCPVAIYCGTMVGSIMLCNSYEDNEKSKNEGKNIDDIIDDLSVRESYEDSLADAAIDEWKSFPDPNEP